MRVAAMDLGSNSFHLLVADVHADGHIDPLVQEKEMLRLGDVVSRHGEIPLTAADQAVATVRRFRLLAEAAGATEILAKATAAIRRAANGGEVVDRIRAETGVHVDVIGGLEEARLIFGAVRAVGGARPVTRAVLRPRRRQPRGDGRRRQRLMWATSVPLGVARLSADFVQSDPISKRDRRALRDHIEAVLAPVVVDVAGFEPKLAVGSSGTLESLAEMVAARRDEDTPTTLNQLTIDRSEFLALHQDLMASKAADRLRLEGLDARRVDLIVAGSMVLATAMDAFGFDQLTISEWALREGIVLDAVRHHDVTEWCDDPHSIRGSAVLSLARRCNWAEPHARQVGSLSLDLFDATAELHGLGDDDRELLEFAALLHDIGEHVASSGHHKHGAYLVRNGQLRGFAPIEVELLAAVVRWHRRGDPRVSDEFPLLDAAAIERVRTLAAILRVADGLDRSRNQNVYGLDAMITPSLVLLRVRALDDAELEIWARAASARCSRSVLDRELELTTHPSAG